MSEFMKVEPLIIVSLNVDIEKEAEFNDFYHHIYTPKLMEIVPELKWVRRYEEYNVIGTLRYLQTAVLCFFRMRIRGDGIKALDAIKNRPGREKEKAEWKRWEKSHLHNIEHAQVYTPCYEHPRRPLDGPFGSRPFFYGECGC